MAGHHSAFADGQTVIEFILEENNHGDNKKTTNGFLSFLNHD